MEPLSFADAAPRSGALLAGGNSARSAVAGAPGCAASCATSRGRASDPGCASPVYRRTGMRQPESRRLCHAVRPMARAEEPGANPGLSRNCDRGASPSGHCRGDGSRQVRDRAVVGRRGERRSGSQETPAMGWTNWGAETREGRGWMMAGRGIGDGGAAGQARSGGDHRSAAALPPADYPNGSAARRLPLFLVWRGPPCVPSPAVVGLDDLQLALLLNAVSPAVGGVLVRGEKGTAKSTVVRRLAALLPAVDVVAGCRFSCDPAAPAPGLPRRPHSARRVPAGAARPAGRAAGRRHRGPARRVARPRARADRRGGRVRAGPARRRAPRRALRRRGQPAARPPGRPAAGRRGPRRELRRARGRVGPARGPVPAGRHHEPGGGRAAARSCSTGSG